MFSSYTRLPTSSSSAAAPTLPPLTARPRRYLPLACAVLVVLTLLAPLVSYGTDWDPSLLPKPWSSSPSQDDTSPASPEHAPASRPTQHLPPPHHRLSDKTGILKVDLRMPVMDHPIYKLLQQARREWDAKVARQSKSLAEAVKEYKRRNGGMNPPKGFDHWWDFVV